MNNSTSNPASVDPVSTVYALCDENGTPRYVGVTSKPLRVRLRQHIQDASGKKETHKIHWIRSMPQPPTIVALECTTDRTREIYWIAEYRAAGYKLTNGTDGGDSLCSPTEEVRAKMRASSRRRWEDPQQRLRSSLINKGRKLTPEQCKRISEAGRGRPSAMRGKRHTELTRAKLSAQRQRQIEDGVRGPMYGKKHSEITRARMSESQRTTPLHKGGNFAGNKLSAEHCAAISAGHKGGRLSAETRAKISAAHVGKKATDEARAKMSASQHGRTHSEDTKAKMSESGKAWRAARRAKKLQPQVAFEF